MVTDSGATIQCLIRLGNFICLNPDFLIAILALVLGSIVGLCFWFSARNPKFRRKGAAWFLDLVDDRVISRWVTVAALVFMFLATFVLSIGNGTRELRNSSH